MSMSVQGIRLAVQAHKRPNTPSFVATPVSRQMMASLIIGMSTRLDTKLCDDYIEATRHFEQSERTLANPAIRRPSSHTLRQRLSLAQEHRGTSAAPR